MGWIGNLWNDLRPSIYWTLIVWVATGGTLGQLTKAVLITFTRLPQIWITPIWLFATAVFGALGMLILGRLTRKQVQPGQKPGLIKTVIDLSIVEDFYRRQDPRLTTELEDEIKKAFVNLHGEDREHMFIRLLTSTIWGLTFSIVWSMIYGSQIKALISLNRGAVARAALQKYYNHAATMYPMVYANYSYDSWLAFMRNNVLLREDGGQIAITVRGQAFLTTMVHFGSSETDRSY